MMYITARRMESLPPHASPIVTAGFRWPPATHNTGVLRVWLVVSATFTARRAVRRTGERCSCIDEDEDRKPERQGDGEQPGLRQSAATELRCEPCTQSLHPAQD